MSNKGKFKNGQVSKTLMQMKKHISQMSNKEQQHLMKEVRHLNRLKLSNHVTKKVKHDGLDFQPVAIVAVLKGLTPDNIVEYNVTLRTNGQKSERLLLRSSEEYPVMIEGKSVVCNLCFSLDITSGDIVTVYWNQATDTHDNIDWGRYQANLKIG